MTTTLKYLQGWQIHFKPKVQAPDGQRQFGFLSQQTSMAWSSFTIHTQFQEKENGHEMICLQNGL